MTNIVPHRQIASYHLGHGDLHHPLPSVVRIPKKPPHHNHPLRIKSETDSRCKQRRRLWLQQPVSSAHVFIFSPCLSAEKTSGRGPCLWRREEGNVHSNILSGAYTLRQPHVYQWIWLDLV